MNVCFKPTHQHHAKMTWTFRSFSLTSFECFLVHEASKQSTIPQVIVCWQCHCIVHGGLVLCVPRVLSFKTNVTNVVNRRQQLFKKQNEHRTFDSEPSAKGQHLQEPDEHLDVVEHLIVSKHCFATSKKTSSDSIDSDFWNVNCPLPLFFCWSKFSNINEQQLACNLKNHDNA